MKLTAFFKIADLFVPSFEMTVSSDLAQVVKRHDGLWQIDLGYSSHDVVQYCDTDKFVLSAASVDLFASLVDEVEFSCGNYHSENCPGVLVEYRDETTVYVSSVYVSRSAFSLPQIQECARNVMALGRSLEKYMDEGGYNQRTYDVL